MLDIIKVKAFLNILRKSHHLAVGGYNIKTSKKKIYLIMYDETARKDTLRLLDQIQDTSIICVNNLEELTSIEGCKIIGIKDKLISKCIVKLFIEGERAWQIKR